MELRALHAYIHFLPCFSKRLERIMYNHLYKYLTDNKILRKKQSGFQTGHSAEHVTIQVVDQSNSNLWKRSIYFSVFIELSKTFHLMLLIIKFLLIAKLQNYGIKGINLLWFKSYQENRKQFTQYDTSSTSYKSITYGIPQGSILGPLLFLIYINNLHEASNILDSIMFTDDKNLFYSLQNINNHFPL